MYGFQTMSSDEYYSSESETDEEYEHELELLEEEKLRDEKAHIVWDLIEHNNIRSPLNGPMDGYTLNECLNPRLNMSDVVYKNFLRYDGHVELHDRITTERIGEFRSAAKALAVHYSPYNAQFSKYIDGVTAHLIKYHYKL